MHCTSLHLLCICITPAAAAATGLFGLLLQLLAHLWLCLLAARFAIFLGAVRIECAALQLALLH
jgi:hypothetical protein